MGSFSFIKTVKRRMEEEEDYLKVAMNWFPFRGKKILFTI